MFVFAKVAFVKQHIRETKRQQKRQCASLLNLVAAYRYAQNSTLCHRRVAGDEDRVIRCVKHHATNVVSRHHGENISVQRIHVQPVTKEALGIVIPVFDDLVRSQYEKLRLLPVLLHDSSNHQRQRLAHDGFATTRVNRQHRDVWQPSAFRLRRTNRVEQRNTLMSHDFRVILQVRNVDLFHQVLQGHRRRNTTATNEQILTKTCAGKLLAQRLSNQRWFRSVDQTAVHQRHDVACQVGDANQRNIVSDLRFPATIFRVDLVLGCAQRKERLVVCAVWVVDCFKHCSVDHVGHNTDKA